MQSSISTQWLSWRARLQKLRAGRLLGRFFAASRRRLRRLAQRVALHHVANLGGCAASQRRRDAMIGR
jgi:hypothetical protein